MGKAIIIAHDKIISDLVGSNTTEGVNCVKPVFGTIRQYFSDLLYDTITQPHFPYGTSEYPDAPTPANYQLQSLNASPVKVITVMCGKGEFGNPADYGMKAVPLGMNRLVRIDDRHLALHWYVDSISILRRAD